MELNFEGRKKKTNHRQYKFQRLACGMARTILGGAEINTPSLFYKFSKSIFIDDYQILLKIKIVKIILLSNIFYLLSILFFKLVNC